jgi:hypothetical protein
MLHNNILVRNISQQHTGIVTNRAININRQTGGQIRQKANGGQGDSVHIANGEGSVHHQGQDDDRDDRRLVSQSDSVNNICGSTGLASIGYFTDGCIGVTGVVLRHQTNGQSTDGSHSDARGGHEWSDSN